MGPSILEASVSMVEIVLLKANTWVQRSNLLKMLINNNHNKVAATNPGSNHCTFQSSVGQPLSEHDKTRLDPLPHPGRADGDTQEGPGDTCQRRCQWILRQE